MKKLRVWLKHRKEFSYHDLNVAEDVGGLAFILEENMEREPSQFFTGLKDKNGKEIYEGDVAIQFYREDKIPMECVWRKTGFVWKCEDDGVSGNWSGEDFEIIGNIYENPEENNL